MSDTEQNNMLNDNLDGYESASNSINSAQNHPQADPTGKYAKYNECKHATPSIVEPIYEKFNDHQVIINGPEYSLDLTYFLCNNCEDLGNLEKEILATEFIGQNPIEENRQNMEFRVIQKISSHKDHASNFFVSANALFFKLNRHKDVLPYCHSRVKLLDNPYLEQATTTAPNDKDQGDVSDGISNNLQDEEEKELRDYVSACWINSHVREYGRSFIASQAPEATSVANFMLMVWEQRIKLLVMLCLQDSDKSNECLAYWEP